MEEQNFQPLPSGASANSTSAPQVNLQDIIKNHRLDLNDPVIQQVLQHPEMVGLTEEELRDKEPMQRAELIVGEYFYHIAKYACELASKLIHKAQWGYGYPDWFDHRHHMLYPEKECNDFWTISADNVIRVLPLNGRLLNFCAGDGFYDYHFYRHRSSEIVCVDINPNGYRHAMRYHRADNIRYILGDLLAYEPPESHFDVVVIRGAIEHFSAENQLAIYKKAWKALKPGGWFVGDTTGNPDKDKTLIKWHDCEWADEDEMRRSLSQVFPHVETGTVFSTNRITLLWRCKKP